MWLPSVTFDPHVTSRTISPPRLSAADKGKGTVWRQDLETEIAQAIEEGGEEVEIAYLVSLCVTFGLVCECLAFD